VSCIGKQIKCLFSPILQQETPPSLHVFLPDHGLVRADHCNLSTCFLDHCFFCFIKYFLVFLKQFYQALPLLQALDQLQHLSKLPLNRHLFFLLHNDQSAFSKFDQRSIIRKNPPVLFPKDCGLYISTIPWSNFCQSAIPLHWSHVWINPKKRVVCCFPVTLSHRPLLSG